ncbi:hypothetical protein SARI_01226 [Salmonella enterica subsp. arizonae serovar 62:z4,z23:-]|uniref:Uncharacterized protein n=1 Tax=Salmonella arizonae (strain ATCC BAA-731 / CDC346-86 / RSK2980) TaxID=41514 RepID=A9MPY4_SALAR|nr:hypothetical protein SARI_01226 [Salmonella enterica subsp. arizonae serovar 62:z4,z23:-]
MVVQEISPRIVKKHLKQAVKAVNIAVEISKTIRNELLKPVKKVARIVTADVNPIIPDLL